MAELTNGIVIGTLFTAQAAFALHRHFHQRCIDRVSALRRQLAAKQMLISAYAVHGRDQRDQLMEQREEINSNMVNHFESLSFDAEQALFCVIGRGRISGTNLRVTHIGDLTSAECHEYANRLNRERLAQPDGTFGVTYSVAEYRCRPVETSA